MSGALFAIVAIGNTTMMSVSDVTIILAVL